MGVCSYADASSACRVGTANQTDCPKHYQLKRVEKCSQVGLSRAVCKRTCCDGWQGSDCRTRNVVRSISSDCPAACDPECVNGECTASDVCTCNPTATGALCNVCTEGWTGAACSTRESFLCLAESDELQPSANLDAGRAHASSRVSATASHDGLELSATSALQDGPHQAQTAPKVGSFFVYHCDVFSRVWWLRQWRVQQPWRMLLQCWLPRIELLHAYESHSSSESRPWCLCVPQRDIIVHPG